METVSGVIVEDMLMLPTSSPPLMLPSALLGCILTDNMTCSPDSGASGMRPEGAFGGLDRSSSSIISQARGDGAFDCQGP